MDDDADPVVKTISVFYSAKYADATTLFQYVDRPARAHTQHPLVPPSLRPPAGENSESKGRLAYRYKPQTQQIEVDVPLERHPERYNEELARELGRGLPGAAESEEPQPLAALTLRGSAVPDAANYCVGVVKGNQLHLTPLAQTFQMRPHLGYLDTLVALNKAKGAAPESDDEAHDTFRAVQITVRNATSAPVQATFSRQNHTQTSFTPENDTQLLKKTETEPWMPLGHFHADTDCANATFDGLLVMDPADGSETVLVSETKAAEYLGL